VFTSTAITGDKALTKPLSREVPIEPAHAALLIVDVQKYNSTWEGGEYAALSAAEKESRFGYFFRTLAQRGLPNMVLLREACRRAGIEVTYTLIESMTADGRDRSLDYKISGFNVPKGSPDAQMVDELTPGPDEIVFPKTSSSVFMSTNIDYVLRNLGTRYLIIAGCLTDQCVDSAVRDACDLGYLVTVPTDACVTLSAERHEWSLRLNRGYCRQVTTGALVEEIARLTAGE
jgi:ureidoacrylate peracid hydrolase